MSLETGTYINSLVPTNPLGSDPIAQADDHIRLIKSVLKNTFPSITGPITVSDTQINEAVLNGGGGGGSGSGGGTIVQTGIDFVATLPATGEYIGQTVLNEADGKLYIWDGTQWVAAGAEAPDVPPAIEIVDSLETNPVPPNGTTVLLRSENKLKTVVNGVWQDLVVTQNVAQEVADGSITTAKFAQGLRAIEVVDTLPTTNNTFGRMVFLTTDNKLYRYTGQAFVSTVNATDLVGVIGADQIAANAITAGKIAAGAVGADQIAANSINSSKIAAGAITAEKIAVGAISADFIAANSITGDKLAANSITAGKIAAGAIGTSQLAANVITSDKIASGAVTVTAIGAGAVGATQISGGAITTAKIAAGAITSDKISVTNLSSINANLGNVTAGSISGTVGLTISNVLTTFQTNSYLAVTNVRSDSVSVGGQKPISSPITNDGNTVFMAHGNGQVGGILRVVGGVTQFTGAHVSAFSKTTPVQPGMIVVDSSRVVDEGDISNTTYEGLLSSSANQKGAIGIYAEDIIEKLDPQYANQGTLQSSYQNFPSDLKAVRVNALGEGKILVCAQNGNISKGDLIVCSDVAGHGMKQSDDIVRGYTVARSREDVFFSSPSDTKLISCVYLCG